MLKLTFYILLALFVTACDHQDANPMLEETLVSEQWFVLWSGEVNKPQSQASGEPIALTFDKTFGHMEVTYSECQHIITNFELPGAGRIRIWGGNPEEIVCDTPTAKEGLTSLLDLFHAATRTELLPGGNILFTTGTKGIAISQIIN